MLIATSQNHGLERALARRASCDIVPFEELGKMGLSDSQLISFQVSKLTFPVAFTDVYRRPAPVIKDLYKSTNFIGLSREQIGNFGKLPKEIRDGAKIVFIPAQDVIEGVLSYTTDNSSSLLAKKSLANNIGYAEIILPSFKTGLVGDAIITTDSSYAGATLLFADPKAAIYAEKSSSTSASYFYPQGVLLKFGNDNPSYVQMKSGANGKITFSEVQQGEEYPLQVAITI